MIKPPIGSISRAITGEGICSVTFNFFQQFEGLGSIKESMPAQHCVERFADSMTDRSCRTETLRSWRCHAALVHEFV